MFTNFSGKKIVCFAPNVICATFPPLFNYLWAWEVMLWFFLICLYLYNLKTCLQIARALQYIHERGIAHLDVKPENIYAKNGIYKLGDFGCATLLDNSLPIEEGDARYMPQEILNEKYDHLDKVDIFSLGVSVYELLRGTSLPEAGHQLLREGKLPLLPSNSLQLQNLLKV